MDRIARAVIAPLVAHSQIPDHIRDILDPREHWLTTERPTATTLLFLLWKIYGALRLLFVWLPLFLTYYVLMFFPVGISILLLSIKTEKVEELQGSKTVATRVIRRLRKWRYTLTHSIRQRFVGMLPYYKQSPIKSWLLLSPVSSCFRPPHLQPILHHRLYCITHLYCRLRDRYDQRSSTRCYTRSCLLLSTYPK